MQFVYGNWGFSQEEWFLLVNEGHAHIAHIAREHGMINYSELAGHLEERTGLEVPVHGDPMRHLLGDIARRSYTEGGVVITALVEYKDPQKANQPAIGFFNISNILGLVPNYDDMTEDERMTFWISQIRASHDAYS